MGPRLKQIGFFIGSTEDSYGQTLVQGALDALKIRQDVRLVFITSGTWNGSQGLEAQKNVLYDMVGPGTLDALILSGSLTHNGNEAAAGELCRRFPQIPVISIAVALGSLPAVITDNRPGMAQLMEHLLDHHGLKHLAFLRGPVGQQEAEVRREVFHQALIQRGLHCPEAWELPGDFTRGSGYRAMKQILSQGRPEFQGVVAANDSMALGALEACEEAGLRIPEDLVLTGFDDLEEGRFHKPRLTTVRQSAFLQARLAVQGILSLWEAGSPPLTSQSVLVLGQSCGCLKPVPLQDSAVLAQFPEDLGHRWWARLQEALTQELQNPGSFQAVLEEALTESWEGDLGARWQLLLDSLQHQSQGGVCLDSEDLWSKARVLVAEKAQMWVARQNFFREDRRQKLLETHEDLNTAVTLPQAWEILNRNLPGLGFRTAYISLFEDPAKPDTRSRLVYQLLDGHPQDLPPGGLVFPSGDLIPGGLWTLGTQHQVIVIEALFSKEARLGFMVLATQGEGTAFCGSLRAQVSGALQGILLLEDRRKALEDLRSSQVDLELQHRELIATNQSLATALSHLERTKEQLVLSEKMAALGGLVAGVAHEINTPLGVALTASSYLQDTTRALETALRSGQMKKSDLEKFLSQTEESSGLIQSNLTRAADLVQSFKRVATDQASEERRSIHLTEYLGNLLATLSPQWKKRPIQVDLQGPPDLKMDTYPGAIAQILTNLVINSLTHGYESGQKGRITVEITDLGSEVRLDVRDDGRGIPEEHMGKIFAPFFTTRRGQGGTGLGLHIVYNLTAVPLGGRVHCESIPGQGTQFRLSLPKVAPDFPLLGK